MVHEMAKVRLRLDPWPADYEGALHIDDLYQDGGAEIDPFVEVDKWKAVVPQSSRRPDRIHFIDGIRRIEARVLVDEAGRLVYGMSGSLAVGSVFIESNSAIFDRINVRRYLI